MTAAALNYFNKSLDDLTIGEAAYLASLPKAPNNYNLDKHPEAALARRNWVIGRMHEDGYITAAEAEAAMAEPLTLHPARRRPRLSAPTISPRKCVASWSLASARIRSTRAGSRCARRSIHVCRRSPTACCATA